MSNEMSIDAMLERWGLRIIGGSLKNPLRISTGGEAMMDDDLRLVAYIESTPGFERAAPVLRHRYSNGMPLESFRIQLPGENRDRALLRLGWFDLRPFRDAAVLSRVNNEFECALAKRLRECPCAPGESAAAGDEGSGGTSILTNSHKFI